MHCKQVTSPACAAVTCLLALLSAPVAADAEKTATAERCTASSTSGAFFDLRPDVALKPNPDGSKPAHSKGAPIADYHARGYDYGFNFTLNICDPVVEKVDNVVGVDEGKWQNISAYYVSKGDVYSLGSMQSGNLTSRGKELVLQYTGGSPCGKSANRDDSWRRARSNVHEGASYRGTADDDETISPWAVNTKGRDSDDHKQRKSATIFFSCDRDPTASSAQVSFIATDPDECSYVFKVKSRHACAGAEPHAPGSVGPGSVFAIILGIAVLVYLLGGIFYQRTVANARGWKQLPNYSFWSSVWSFLCDFFVIATSSCARLFPSRRGYHYISGSPNGRGRSNREDENRLIDQYDEEWED
ncbi:mannose 6-phosphate receptor domain-containing protein [Xylariomycetidae sp. FL2044]|nr:mannose 6-phosphate receptor domain-containing protein [Xylariomycetidae sp. FL2044]